MHYVYVLLSEKDGKLYKGMTSDVAARLLKHQAGGVPSTKHRRPLRLMYVEECRTRAEAAKREKYLKSGAGTKYLKTLLSSQLDASRRIRSDSSG